MDVIITSSLMSESCPLIALGIEGQFYYEGLLYCEGVNIVLIEESSIH